MPRLTETRVETNSDTNGRDFYPPSESTDEDYSRARSLSQPSLKRHNLSLNIAGLSQQFQYANTASPTTLASSGAPYTDSLSSYNFDNEYFPFDHTSFPSAVPSDGNTNPNDPPLAPPFQFGPRQPASQPSSPARNVFPPGQNPYDFQSGRQRSTTFSGGYQYSDFGGQLSNPPSALPSHFSFSQVRNPVVDSPLSASPIVPNNAFLTEPVNPDTLMEDVSTPLANQQNLQTLGVEQLPEHMVSSLNIIDQLENRIRDIKQATLQDLAGNHAASVAASLSQLNHEVGLQELAVPPSMVNSNTPSSQGVSPAPYHPSPSISVAPPQSSPYQPAPMAPSPYQSIAPSQPPPSVYQPARSLAQINTNAMPPPQQMQISPVKSHAPQQSLLPSLPVENKRPPPLDMNNVQGLQVPISYEPPPMVHSHSFPNGHQLPSQIHAPNTPVSASPSFVNALGVPHAPVISSPLAAMPVSRPASPPRTFPLPDQPPLPIVYSESDLKLESRSDMSKRPSANRTRSTSVHRSKVFNGNGMMSSASIQSNPPSAWHSRANSPDEDEDEASDDNGAKRYKRRRSSADVGDMSSVEISSDVKLYLDEIFLEFLNKVCSDRGSWTLSPMGISLTFSRIQGCERRQATSSPDAKEDGQDG